MRVSLTLSILTILAAVPVVAQSDVPIAVTFEHGTFQFSDLRSFRTSKTLQRDIPCISGTIRNETNSAWNNAKFTVTITFENGRQAIETIEISSIPLGSKQRFESPDLEGRYVARAAKSWDIQFEGGRRTPSPQQALIEEKAQQAEWEAQKANAAKAAAARRAAAVKVIAEKKAAREAELAQLPKLSGADLHFVGYDKKCVDEFLDASSMEGLAKRKRIAELISYQCGFIENDGVPVDVLAREGKHVRIRIRDGHNTGKVGWVFSGVVK